MLGVVSDDAGRALVWSEGADGAWSAEIRRMRTDRLRFDDSARQLAVGRTSLDKYLDGLRVAAEQPAV